VSQPAFGPSPWQRDPTGETPGGADFAVFAERLRVLLDDVTAARPPDEVWAQAIAQINALDDLLAPHAVPESEQIVGYRIDLPGRGQVLAPVVHVDELDGQRFAGRVTFGRYYLGGNGAVHGGALPLVFDEVLGRLANTGRTRSRTAYLHVNYRSITPIDAPLRITARFDREEGRKRFLIAELHHGDTLVADADGLFVALNPGQQ
jgi:hypothetical protein